MSEQRIGKGTNFFHFTVFRFPNVRHGRLFLAVFCFAPLRAEDRSSVAFAALRLLGARKCESDLIGRSEICLLRRTLLHSLFRMMRSQQSGRSDCIDLPEGRIKSMRDSKRKAKSDQMQFGSFHLFRFLLRSLPPGPRSECTEREWTFVQLPLNKQRQSFRCTCFLLTKRTKQCSRCSPRQPSSMHSTDSG